MDNSASIFEKHSSVYVIFYFIINILVNLFILTFLMGFEFKNNKVMYQTRVFMINQKNNVR